MGSFALSFPSITGRGGLYFGPDEAAGIPTSMPQAKNSSTGFSVNGVLDTLAATGLNIYKTVSQNDLISQQIKAGQTPSIGPGLIPYQSSYAAYDPRTGQYVNATGLGVGAAGGSPLSLSNLPNWIIPLGLLILVMAMFRK